MKHGFIKVASAAPEMHLADCVYNAKKIAECAKAACAQGITLLVTLLGVVLFSHTEKTFMDTV